MEGEGMVAVVRGLKDAGLAVTLLDGNRQYTLMPNSITHTNTSAAAAQRSSVSNSNASTQPSPPKFTADSSTESSVPHVDNGAQAVDGRYASMYKTMYCNMRPTSPPIQLTEFPPQRADLYPGHGNFQVGGTGSGATYSPIRASSPVSFRGGLSWPDRGSVCSPRPSLEVDAFANSLRKYPNLSPDRSSEVMERLINYSQNKGLTKSSPRNLNSPTRLSEPCSYHTLETKATTRISRAYEPEVSVRSKRVEEPPTRDRKRDDHHDRTRAYDVRCIRDMSKRLRDNVKAMSSYLQPYNHPICPTIKENHDYHPCPSHHHHSSNSVNMEIQAAVKMISKEVATAHRDRPEKTVALPSSAGEENIEGECYYVHCLDTNTSFKSIQTTFCPSDETLRPKKSAHTVCSSIDLKPKQRNRFVGRKSKSQDQIKVSKDELRRSLLKLIEEVSSATKSKKIIRDELIKKLFDTDRSDRDDNKSDRGKRKRERIDKYVSTFCPTGCDYVGDFKELVGKLKQSYGDTKQVMRTAVKSFRISEFKKLDFVLKDWINNLNIKIRDTNTQPTRAEILNTVEDQIKELFKNRTTQDFDLKSAIVKIIEEIPIEVHQSYNKKSYLHRLVDVLLKRLKNVVIISQQNRRIRRKAPVNRSNKILTEDDLRDFIREHLMDFFDECHVEICEYEVDELENALIDVLIDSIDCIRCGHIDDASDEMEIILQDLAQLTDKQADYISHVILQNLQELLNNCNFSQTYTILHSNVNSGQHSNNTTDTDLSIGAITEGDVNTNLDHYTNQLSQRINEWLDDLNINISQDKGFREVVVNDLAGDIVDRHKYMELNPNIRDSEEDHLKALKYQIFKWINKLVGEENTETISHAPELMQKINSVPVPMLTNPQARKTSNSEEECQPFDPMRPCLGETGNTCRSKRKKSPKKTQDSPVSPGPQAPAAKTGQDQSGTSSDVVQDGQAPKGPYSQAPQGGPGQPGPNSITAQESQGPQGYYGQGSAGLPDRYLQSAQGSPGQPGNYSQTTQGSPGLPERYFQPTQSSPGYLGNYSPIAQSSAGPPGFFSQSTQGTPGHPGNYSQIAQGSPGLPEHYLRPAQGSPGLPARYLQPTQGSPGHPGNYSQIAQGSPGQPGFYSQTTQGSPGLADRYLQPAQGSPGPSGNYSQTAQGSPGQPGFYSQTTQGGPGLPERYLQPTQGSPGQPGNYSQTAQGSPGQSGFYSQTTQGSPGLPERYLQPTQGSPGHPGNYSQTTQGSPGQPGNYSQIAQGSPGQPGHYLQTAQDSQVTRGTYGQGFPNVQGSQNQSFGPAQTPHGQVISNIQGSPGAKFLNAAQNSQSPGPIGHDVQSVQSSPIPFHQSLGPAQTSYGQVSSNVLGSSGDQTGPISFGPSPESVSSPSRPQDPNHNWNRPPSSTIRNPAGNFSQIPMYETGGTRPTSGRMSSPGAMSSQNQQAMYRAGPGGAMVSPQGAQNTTFTGAMAPGQMEGNVNASGAGMASLTLTGTSAGKRTPCCINPDGTGRYCSSIKRLNDEYDEYLKQWVQRIPIQATKPAEQQSAEKDRLGVYNGIWKAITKLKLDPEVFSNPYNYNDAFHEELDALLGSLPKSRELDASKHKLKAELLERTLAMNEMIRSTNAPGSFKQQIMENIGNNLPRKTVNQQDPIQQNEEVQKINLAEHYILYTRYKEEDSLKANVHKKNFLKKLEVFLDTIRKTYGTDMKKTVNANDIINSLDRIPIPHLNAFKEEADDILLGMEVENWISDIPQNPDNTLPLEKRRIRDAIVKKVQELGSKMSFSDCAFPNLLKLELPKYIEKIPIKPGTNTEFVIEELANRLKNIPKDMRQRAVSFQDSLDYQEFSRNLPASSSFVEHKSDYGSSYNIEGGNVVKDGDPKGWVSFKMATSVDTSQWQSLQATQTPSGLVNWSQGQQSMQPQPYGQMHASRNHAGDYSYSNAVPVQNQILGSSGAYGQVYSNVQGSPVAVGQMPTKGPCCINQICQNKSHLLTQGLAKSRPHSTQNSTIPQKSRVPLQRPCCTNVPCSNRAHSLTQGPPSQVHQEAYGQAFANVRGSPLPYNIGQGSTAYGQVLPSIQENLGDKSINATEIGQVPPQGFYGQGSRTQYNQDQSFGPTPAAYDQVLGSIQGSPGAGQISQIPQGYSGQGDPNIQGSSILYNQGQSFGTVSGPYGQVLPNVQGGSVPVSQMHSQGPNATYTSQAPQAPYGQGFSNVQGSAGPYSQGQSFGPAQAPYGQMSQNIQDSSVPMNQMYSQGQNAPSGTQGPYGFYGQGFSNVQGIADLTDPYSQGQSFGPVQGPYGQVSPNVQGSSMPAGQMPYQGPNAGHISQGSQGNYGQAFPNAQGSPAYIGQVPTSGVTNAQGSPAYMGQVPTSGVTNAQGTPAYMGQGPTSGVTNAQGSPAYMGQVPTSGVTNAPGTPAYMGQGPTSGVTNAQGSPAYMGQGPTSGVSNAQGSPAYMGQVPTSGVTNAQGTPAYIGQGPTSGVTNAQGSPAYMGQVPTSGVTNAQGRPAYMGQGPTSGVTNAQGSPAYMGQVPTSGITNAQGSPAYMGQVPTSGITNAQGSPAYMGQVPTSGITNPQGRPAYMGQGPTSGVTNAQGSPAYMGQVPTSGIANAQGSPAYMGQIPTSGVTGYYGQEYQSGQPSFLSAGDQVQQTKNQTAQSFGPVSAASQVPDSRGGQQKQNLQEMAGGGMGVLGTSQDPGPSTETPQSAQQSQTQKSEGQQPAGTDGDGNKPTTDLKSQEPPTTADSNEPAPCPMDPPVCCYIPQEQQNRDCPRRSARRCQGVQRPDAARKKMEIDETDTSTDKEREKCRCIRRGRRQRGRKPTIDDLHMEYPPCYPIMRYPCYY